MAPAEERHGDRREDGPGPHHAVDSLAELRRRLAGFAVDQGRDEPAPRSPEEGRGGGGHEVPLGQQSPRVSVALAIALAGAILGGLLALLR